MAHWSEVWRCGGSLVGEVVVYWLLDVVAHWLGYMMAHWVGDVVAHWLGYMMAHWVGDGVAHWLEKWWLIGK